MTVFEVVFVVDNNYKEIMMSAYVCALTQYDVQSIVQQYADENDWILKRIDNIEVYRDNTMNCLLPKGTYL